MMNVYTRRPNRLNGDIFTAFEDTDDFGQQRGGRQTKKEVCFDLGDSLMPVDMERKDCDNKDSGLKGKVKIPDLFQGIEMNKGVNAGRSENMNAVTTKTRGDIDKDKIVLQNRKDDKIVVDGIKQGTESSAKTEVNRPASKLIEDQNDLGTLFDTLHGKEADKAVSRRIGKLRMPGIFDKASLGNQKSAGKKTDAGNDLEKAGNGGVRVEAGKDREAGLKSGRGRSFDNALEMSFSDWKRGSEPEKEAEENTYGMQNREDYNFGVYKGDGMRGGWADRSSNEKGGSASDRTKGADRIDESADISVRNNIWMPMKNGSQSFTPQKSGENQNCQAANGKNIDGMKQGTSDSQLIVINDAKGDLAGKGLFMNKSTNIREGEEDCLVGRQRFEGIKELETAMVNNEDKSNSLAANGRGNATIGKLKMPEKFANVGGNSGQRKDLGNRQKGTRLSEKGFEGNKGIVSTAASNSNRRSGRENSQKINENKDSEGSKGIACDGATNTKKQSDFAVKQNGGKVNENQRSQGSRGIFNAEASKSPIQESMKKFETEKKRFQNGNPVDNSRFSQSEKIGHDAVVNTMDTDGNQASKVSSDGSGKVGKLEFGSGINARESQSSQPVFSDTSDGLVENSSNTGHKPQRQIGRLNINSIFANANDKESGKADKEKDNNSVFSKNKAVFDQKPKKTQGKQDKVGKLRVNSTRSERDEELANLSPEGEVPSNMSANMKLQLEKILQQRSASVSSQGSLVSPKNDGRESSSSRLSISSVSSGGSPRFRGSFSSDSNLLRYTSYEESDNGDDQGPKKVNNGSLKFQLDGIFQARVPGSGSVESSPANSLDASLNSEGFDDSDLSERKPSVEDDRKDKRKLIADAIKLKYGGKLGGEKRDNREDGGERDDKDDSEAKSVKDYDKGDKGSENTAKQFISENDIGITADSDMMGSMNARQGNRSWKGTSDRPGDKETPSVPNSQEYKSTEADGRGGYDQENKSLENAKRRGKVSIPGIFSGMPDAGIRDKETGNAEHRARSATLKGGQPEMATSRYEETGTRCKELPREDSTEKKERVNVGIRKLNIPSNFQTNSAARKSGDGDDNNSRPKAVSFMQKSAESNDLMNGKKTEHPQDLNQVTGGIARESIERVKNSDEIKEDNANEETRRKPAGKLSSSLFQAFQRNDKESTGEKLSGGNSSKATGVRASNNSSSGKLASQAHGQSSVHDTVSRMKEISTENEAMSRGIDTPVQVEKEDGRHGNDGNSNNNNSHSNNNNNNEDANNDNNNNDDNNNEDDKYNNKKGIGFEAKTKWQSQQSFKQDQLQPSTEVVVSSKRTVGKLNIPLAFK